MNCEEAQTVLAQWVADGYPRTFEYQGLREHLADCAACRLAAGDLERVEQALRAWPLRPVPVGLARRILAAIEREIRVEPWEPLPWNVWLPAMTLLAAVALALLLAPPLPSAVPPMSWLEPAAQWPGQLRFPDDQGLLAALWLGGSLAVVGIGITLALVHGRLPTEDEVDNLRHRLWDKAHRLLRLAGH
jgi:hypothetical protein